MNGHHLHLAENLDRIASLTSVIRTRNADAERREVNGGTNGDIARRVQDAAKKLAKIASDLERAVA